MIVKLKLWIPNYRTYYKTIYIKKSPSDILFLVRHIPRSELIYHAIIRLSRLDNLTHWD